MDPPPTLHVISDHEQGAIPQSSLESEPATFSGSRKRQRSVSLDDDESVKRARYVESGEQRDRSPALVAYEHGRELHKQWKDMRNRFLLDAAIASFEKSLGEGTSDDFLAWKAQDQLSIALSDRWRWHGREDVTDVNRSVELYYAALADWPPDHPDKLSSIGNRIIGWVQAEVNNLSELFERCKKALDRISLDHPIASTDLNELASCGQCDC